MIARSLSETRVWAAVGVRTLTATVGPTRPMPSRTTKRSGRMKTATATATTLREVGRMNARQLLGASTRDRFGCLDVDFDGFSDENDRYPADPTRWADSDNDSYGDNPLGANGDSCPSVAGNSTLGLLGCPDQDGDGYADQTDDLPLEPTRLGRP